uniref:Zmp:0000000912 n=1 Tax=Cyprinus carpio TaxID=7962 RepID=A0A8C2GYV4_CYPCA
MAEHKDKSATKICGQEPGGKKKSNNFQLQHDCKQRKDVKKGELEKEPPQYEDKDPINLENINKLFNRLKLSEKSSYKLRSRDFLQVAPSIQRHKPCNEKNLVQTYIQGLLMADYKARYIPIEEDKSEALKTKTMVSDTVGGNAFEKIFKRPAHVAGKIQPIHPMDIQMAVFHCADSFLRQLMVTKLSQCQYALPLLVPDLFTQEIGFPLWTFRQFKKSWKSHNENIIKNQTIYKAETPMIAFFRFSAVSSSKSELMNNLINERHDTFFHRHCRGSTKSRLLMDGVVEIAWYCPSGEKTDKFPDCIAFCNLHGNAQDNERQLQILTEESSINVVLLPNLEERDKSMTIVEKLYNSTKPLICLLTEEDSVVSKVQEGKYTIGLNKRSRSDVSEELRETINECLSKSLKVFKLENMGERSEIIVDERDDSCRRGKEAAVQMIRLLKTKEMSKIKETFLPCQGKLWHDWCLKSKELHRPQGDNIEMHTSQKQTEMHKIREQQKEFGLSEFSKMFIEKLNTINADEKMYFLKWLGILLDEYTSKDLCKLHHEYYEKWSKVLDLKKEHDKSEQLTVEQIHLEMLLEKLNAATFGLEHILREIGQIYESNISVNKKNKGSGRELDVRPLPQFAAELMISGYPLELMDGDAAHVPLIWVQAVLGELIKMLGDPRVFVLSILGIQSTGKSTMLNAMFGLQFAVSAGRCTKGAFMQLVKVSEELKKQLNFDYILVVDTEGLHALELPCRSSRHHDNEMATFVVGLGNMTLINIFGENPAEMQDILQIVVQAFLRMKKVRLNPSCVFVHQNVSDVTAGNKNKEGRRQLQEKLDEMTKLAAKEEECDAECFSDVTKFDIQNDVRYFADCNIQKIRRGVHKVDLESQKCHAGD